MIGESAWCSTWQVSVKDLNLARVYLWDFETSMAWYDTASVPGMTRTRLDFLLLLIRVSAMHPTRRSSPTYITASQKEVECVAFGLQDSHAAAHSRSKTPR